MGLELADASPHYATISRFRQQLTAYGLAAALFAEVSRQLAAHGLVVKAGTLLDATLVQAQAHRPRQTAGPGAKRPTDPDAAWTRRGGQAHFGYKVQLGVAAGRLPGAARARRAGATAGGGRGCSSLADVVQGSGQVYRETSDHAAPPQPDTAELRTMGRQQWVYRRSPAAFPPDFPHCLERLKDAAGLPWRGLARRLGVDARQLRRWRTGTRPGQSHSQSTER